MTKTLLALLLATAAAASASTPQRHPRTFQLGAVQSDSSAYPPGNSVSHVASDNSTHSFWIGTERGLARSRDGARTWTAYLNDPAFADPGIFAIAPRGDTVWAATGYDKAVADGTVQTGSGYAWSGDGGATWTHRPQTLDARGDSIFSYGINDSLWWLPVVVPEQNVTFDIATTPGRVWIASWASGIRYSDDNGAHWTRVLLPADNRNSIAPTDTLFHDTLGRRFFNRIDPRLNNNYLGFAVCAEDADTIWGGTAGGINKSTDGGVSWVKFNHLNEDRPITGNWVIAVKVQRFGTTRRIWTTNWPTNNDEDYGVSYSDDGGLSWTNLLPGIDNRAYDFAFKDSICYIATDAGIYRTADGGRSLSRFSSFVDDSSHQQIASPQTFASAVIGDTVLVGTADGLAKTIDNAAHPFGERWEVIRGLVTVGATAATYAYPNPFSPKFEVVRIHYGSGTSGGTRRVRIQIFDFGMNRVRTLINDAARPSATEPEEVWDGHDDHGRVVANGVYFYRIDVDSDEPRFGKILVLQ